MTKSHYDILGVDSRSTPDQIKSAYRKIAREHHPDLSKDPKSTDIFVRATEAYDVLIDPTRRKNYDAAQRAERAKEEQQRLRQSEQLKRTKSGPNAQPIRTKTEPIKMTGQTIPKTNAPPQAQFRQSSENASVTIDVTRLTLMFNRGRFHDAGELARKILRQDPRQPIPYAVLGDLSRQQGDMTKAAEMYALAIQMDPHNNLYRDRYEELLEMIDPPRQGHNALHQDGKSSKSQTIALMAALAVTVLGAIYVVISRETPVFRGVPIIGTYTIGLVVMLFLSGVAIGASMSLANMLDRFSSLATTSIGRTSPSVALAVVAIVNFWAAAILYLLIGLTQGSFNFSTTRVVISVGAATTLLALACYFGQIIDPIQSFLWGGNICYIGSLCGWMVADSFRH